MSPVAASMPHAPEMVRGDSALVGAPAPLKQGMQQPSLDVSSLFSQEGTARQQGVLRWVAPPLPPPLARCVPCCLFLHG